MEFASARRAPPELAALALVALALGPGGACHRHRGGATAGAQGGAPPAALPAATARVAGLVLDGRGQPVPDARVLAFPLADGGAGVGEPARATAELDGRFALDHLSPGPYRILVEAAGFPAAELAPIAAPASDLTVKLTGAGRSIQGRVVGERDQPAVGARVLLGAEAGGPIRETVARTDGRFAFAGLGDGAYALRAVDAGQVSATVREVVAREGQGGTALGAPLRLARGQVVPGRLVQDAGAGLGGFEVRAESTDLPPGAGDDPLPVVTRTDPSGMFTFVLAPGAYRLTAARAGHVLRRAPSVTVKPVTASVIDSVPAAAPAPAAATPPVLLELVRGAQVSGRVTDPHGGGVAGARVHCVASVMDDLTVQSGPLPLAAEAAALPSGAGRALGSTRSAIADAHGRFTVDDLIPGRYRIEVAEARFEPLRTDELTLAPGERRELGPLALREGFPVTGRVLDEAGGPIEGARVTAAAGADPSVAGLGTVTDGAGVFSIALPPGDYRLGAAASGHGPARAAVAVAAGASPPPVELRLPRAEAVLEGLVRDTGGRPLGRARLLVWPRDGVAGASGEAPLGSGSADVGGHFRLNDLPAGELRVEVQHPDYPRVTLPVTAGQFATLTVPLPGGITGEARARASGAAVTRGRVEASGPEGAHASADLQRAGSFRLPRLAPGHWRLTVSAPGFHPADQELDVPASATIGEPSVRDLRVELDPT